MNNSCNYTYVTSEYLHNTQLKFKEEMCYMYMQYIVQSKLMLRSGGVAGGGGGGGGGAIDPRAPKCGEDAKMTAEVCMVSQSKPGMRCLNKPIKHYQSSDRDRYYI